MVLELITSLEYELEVNRYIHLNPIQARMVADLDDNKWSSFFFYIGHKKDDLVSTERIFTYFPEPKVENYLRFLQTTGKDLNYIQHSLPTPNERK